MKNIFIALCLAVMAVGCGNDSFEDITPKTTPEFAPDNGGEPPLVRFNMHSADGVSVNTKGYDANLSDYEERAISNYNIFCYNEKSGREVHQYVTSSKSVDLKLDQGTWDVYVIANTNTNLSDCTRAEVEKYKLSYMHARESINDYSRLHMAYHDTIEVTEDETIDLKLVRAYAKVNVNINLTGAASGYKIISRKVNKAPMFGYLFEDNLLTLLGISFDTEEDFSFYMFENLQGTNTDIKTAKNKIKANAPTYATYIEVVAKSSNEEIKYTYYLGENTINDFNIRRNHTYNINMNISGNSSSDLRVETTTIPTVTPDPVLTYKISGDYNRQPYVNESWFQDFDDDFTFTLEFESGNDSTINIELLTDLNNVNSDDSVEYWAMLVTESVYNKFVSGYYDDNDIFNSSLNLLRTSATSSKAALASCWSTSTSDSLPWLRHTYAKVKPNTTYKLVLQKWWQLSGDPAKKHDMRVYMNKGTTNQRYVDLNFTTITY